MQKINNKKFFLSLIILLAAFSSAILIKNIAILKKETDLNDTTKLTKEIFAMDTIMSLTAYTSANDVLNLCEEKIIELERLYAHTIITQGKSLIVDDTNLTTVDFGASTYFSCDEKGVITGPKDGDGITNSGTSKCDILEALPANTKCTSYSVPQTVNQIEPLAFQDHQYIKEFNSAYDDAMNTNLDEIPESCFKNCSALDTVYFGTDTTNIDANSFENVKNGIKI